MRRILKPATLAGRATKTLLLILLGLLMLSGKGYAQTYDLPDINLRNKLIKDYPWVMTGNQLNITAASAYTGALNLRRANISDASGIQFFTKIITLDIGRNNLTTLPNISGLTQLVWLFADSNQLATLPDISNLKNLMNLQVFDNQLESLPPLAGLTKLMFIYCQNNKLTSLPDLSPLTSLWTLDIGNNNFGTLPDFSPFVNLRELHVHQTGIDTIRGLSKLTQLEQLYAWGNRIRDLSGINSNTKLVVLHIFDNELKSLPVLSNKPLNAQVSFILNQLSFEDILPLKSHPSFGVFDYSPQKKLFLSSQNLREMDPLTLTVTTDPGVTNNTYLWYKNGTALTGSSSRTYTDPSVTKEDSGAYYVQITNPGLPGLTLESIISQVRITAPCMELNNFFVQHVSESCTEGTSVEMSMVSIPGGVAPFSYHLAPTIQSDTVHSAIPAFSSLTPGIYNFIVRDSRSCEVSNIVNIKTPPGCSKEITPNGDGIMDTYYIEEKGKVRIYDVRRKLVKELNAPAIWDGTTSDGNLASDGYYAIVVNDKKVIHITLIK